MSGSLASRVSVRSLIAAGLGNLSGLVHDKRCVSMSSSGGVWCPAWLRDRWCWETLAQPHVCHCCLMVCQHCQACKCHDTLQLQTAPSRRAEIKNDGCMSMGGWCSSGSPYTCHLQFQYDQYVPIRSVRPNTRGEVNLSRSRVFEVTNVGCSAAKQRNVVEREVNLSETQSVWRLTQLEHKWSSRALDSHLLC